MIVLSEYYIDSIAALGFYIASIANIEHTTTYIALIVNIEHTTTYLDFTKKDIQFIGEIAMSDIY